MNIQALPNVSVLCILRVLQNLTQRLSKQTSRRYLPDVRLGAKVWQIFVCSLIVFYLFVLKKQTISAILFFYYYLKYQTTMLLNHRLLFFNHANTFYDKIIAKRDSRYIITSALALDVTGCEDVGQYWIVLLYYIFRLNQEYLLLQGVFSDGWRNASQSSMGSDALLLFKLNMVVFSVQCSAVQCSAVQCSAVQCSAV